MSPLRISAPCPDKWPHSSLLLQLWWWALWCAVGTHFFRKKGIYFHSCSVLRVPPTEFSHQPFQGMSQLKRGRESPCPRASRFPGWPVSYAWCMWSLLRVNTAGSSQFQGSPYLRLRLWLRLHLHLTFSLPTLGFTPSLPHGFLQRALSNKLPNLSWGTQPAILHSISSHVLNIHLDRNPTDDNKMYGSVSWRNTI